MKHLTTDQLAESPVVANCSMNRERVAFGVNSYERELGFSPVEFMRQRLGVSENCRWLDICCGQGNALAQTVTVLDSEGFELERLDFVGVDLVDFFASETKDQEGIDLVVANIEQWDFAGRFDLITCVHGLHYLGDKLVVIAKSVSALKNDGLFIANFDEQSIVDESGAGVEKTLLALFKENSLQFDKSRHLLTCQIAKQIKWPAEFVAADDSTGPNYTGQPAVTSIYKFRTSSKFS